jgi:hypothetical protein
MPPLNIASQYRHTHRAATTSPVRCLVRDSQITSSFEPQIGQLGGSRNAIPTVQIKQKGYRSAVRFSVFSSQGIGGEAVLTQNRLSLDVQAAGGLYDISPVKPSPIR